MPCPPEDPSSTTIKLLRSPVLRKRPDPSCLLEGQPAVNYNPGEPGLFFRDSTGSGLIKIGPCHVGATAPNAVPATGGYAGNCKGELWLDTTSVSQPTLKVWDGVKWNAYGYTSSNTIWVDPAGDDDNLGNSPQAPKKTIKAALEASYAGCTIQVSPGSYSEDNPLIFPVEDVSLIGDGANSTIIDPQNSGLPLFNVNSGSLIEGFSFSGSLDSGTSVVAFVPPSPDPVEIIKPPSVADCRNLIAGSVGILANGALVDGDPTIITQNYIQNSPLGTGLKAINKGFIQAAGCQTVYSEKSAIAQSGGTITLSGCKTSCGTFGLIASGKGSEEQFGLISSTTNGDILALDTVLGTQRPYIGQVVSVGEVYYKGYRFSIPYQGVGYTGVPTVQVSIGSGPNAIPAAGVAVVEGGKVIDIVLTRPGTGYTSSDTIIVTLIGGDPANPASAELEIEPIYYPVMESTEITANTCTVTLAEKLPYIPSAGDEVRFYRASSIIASSHMMEYVGCGTNSPYDGVPPIRENQVIQENGGRVFFSSMDESGIFSVGNGFMVNQTTGEVSGEGFSRSVLNLSIPQTLTLK